MIKITRNKLPKDMKKSENINFPVTKEQKQELIKRANEEKQTLADYLRKYLFNND